MSDKWYVRDIDEGRVWGPMSKDEAENMTNQADDLVMFNERIFEPQFVLSDEVQALIGDLEGMAAPGAPDCIEEIAGRAVDTLILLSAKRQVHGTVNSGIIEIDDCPPDVEVTIDDYDIEGIDDPDRIVEDDDGQDCLRLTFRG